MNRTTLNRIFADPAEFRRHLLIDAGGPRELASVVDDWQLADFAAMDPGWRRVAGQESPGAKLRGYLERPRGHSKTSDLAAMVTWALIASRHRINGISAAADKDQAKLLRDAIARLVDLNRWLADFLDVQSYRVVNVHTGSELQILASDAASAYGQVVDFVTVDELTHWSNGSGEAFWDSIFSTVAKKPDCLALIISNAGVGQGSSWQWKIREACRLHSDRWHFSSLDGPAASWITPEVLEEQQRLLPPKAYRRLWLNQWVVEASDFLEEADIQAAINPQLKPMLNAQDPRPNPDLPYLGPPRDMRAKNWTFTSGLDISVKRDHTALVTVCVDHDTRRIRLASVRHWVPPRGGQIDLEDVERAVVEVSRRFGGVVNFDPHQGQMLAQRARRQGVSMREVSFVPSATTKMASSLLQAFKNRTIDLFPHPQLLADLRRVVIVQSSNGTSYKLDAARGSDGSHADCAIGLALALFDAVDQVESRGRVTKLAHDPRVCLEVIPANWGDSYRQSPGGINRPWF